KQIEKKTNDYSLGLNEDEAERRLLRDKPSCFIVLGKPGVGRSTLAKKLAESWKCVFVDGNLFWHLKQICTRFGFCCFIKLSCASGNPVPEQKVFQLILEKLHSPDVQHYGYVLSCLPSMSEQHLKVQEQVDLIRNLPLPPDFIINIKCEDQDLVQRLGDLRQHPATGRVFGKEQWDSVGREAKQRRHDLEEEDEEEDQIDESETVCIYVSDYMADHHHMYLFEVDGNKDPEDLLGNVLSRLESMAVNRVPVPVRLLQAEEDELPDEIDTDKLLPILASCKMVASGCRWRRSRWGRVCPVALKEGKIVMGKPEFSLGFLDKMYVLSSHDALQRFMQNPRQYLLPPMPRPPCKVCVIGPPCSGKTTLSHLLAEHYGAALLNVEKLMQPLVAEVTLKHLERLRQETTLVAIEKVKLKVEQESVNAAVHTLVWLNCASMCFHGCICNVHGCVSGPFQYMAQELSGEDEEEEDAQAMNEEEEEEPQGEEEELEVCESVPQHTLGDTLHYCPVVLKERASLVPCRDEHPARYRERVHYCSSPETLQRFLSNPQYYVCHTHLLQPPALRLFLLGVRSSGKTNHGKWLAERLGLFHIQFRECLQELLLKKTQQRVQYRDLTEPPSDSPDQLQDLLRELEGPNGLEESNNSNTHSDEEEAIKAYLMDGEPLPQEVLEMVLPQWWEQEPFRSTGFILEGFPQNQEEVQFMVERYLYPDAAVVMTLDVGDIMGRTLPFHLQRWRERHDRRKDTQLRAEAIANRRAELIEEHKVNAENWQEEIEVLLEEEFPPEEEEEVGEDEETETSAEERLQDDIAARFETDSNNLNSVLPVNAGRMQRIVRYQLLEKVEPLLLHRKALFIKPQPISYSLAQRLLYHSYKYYSAFGRWDPVRLAEGDPLQPPQTPSYPAMLRQFIYFFSSRETRHTFMKNPIRYLQQTSPNPSLPIRLAIVGPPNSGKTTVAGMFASEYGLAHLSLSEVMQRVLNDQGQTELANQMRQQLSQGLSVPDELAVRCLEVVLMDLPCSTRGYVLDGFPVTQQQAKLMAVRSIVPVLIIEMQLDTVEVLKRGLKGDHILPEGPIEAPHLNRNMSYIRKFRSHFQQLHQNWVHVDAQRNKWSVWTQVLERVHVSMAQIHTYLQRIRKGQAAGIAHLCVTPKELQARLGEFGHYCPVSLALHHHLVDCSGRASFRLVAEYRKCYYRMASAEFLQKFLESPERFVLPACPHPLPPPHLLPRKLSEVQVKRHFPQQVEMKGYCPVTFGDGQLRYESLVKGSVEYAVEYREKIYVLEGEEKREKFLRQPHVYWDLKLPHKLPPLAEPVQLTSLPMLGYLEQGVAKAIIKAMTAVGCLKPKFPYLSAKRSALLYVAVYLKAFNPRLSQFTRHKFRCQLAQLEESCELISYLSSAMADTNSEPQEKSVVFQHKLHQFLASEKSFH
uniref:Nucleoside-diphosphate kinase n=1 Tax=Denticeps clupeoides TaxID=299321 RepID=A0AAY4DP69_9TELE